MVSLFFVKKTHVILCQRLAITLVRSSHVFEDDFEGDFEDAFVVINQYDC
jgi:hypothetical protein